MSFDLLNCMRSFSKVADCNGFAPAARALRISASTLTKQIKFLEEWVGKPLLQRTTRYVALTEAGNIYLKQVQKILADVQQAKQEVQQLEKTPHGILTIGIPGVFNSMFYIKLLQNFLKKYPKIILKTIDENSPAQLLEGKADLVISEENLHDKQLIKEKLFTLQRGLYASPEYLKKHGTPKSLDDLKNHNCIIYSKVSPNNCWITPKNKKIVVKGNFVSNSDMNTICAAVVGIGILWCSPLVINEELKAGKLIEIKLPAKPLMSNVYLYYRPMQYGSNVRLIVDHLKKNMAKY